MIELSQETAVEQARRHPEMSGPAYGRLQEGLLAPVAIVRTGTNRGRLFWQDGGGKWWRAVNKTTRDGKELFLVSMPRRDAVHAARDARRKQRDGR